MSTLGRIAPTSSSLAVPGPTPETRIGPGHLCAGSSGSRISDAPYAVALGARGYALVWCIVAGLYAIGGFCCWVFALTYYIGATYKDGYHIEFIDGLDLRYIPIIVAIYALAGGVQWWRLGRMLLESLRHRRLVLSSSFSRPASPSSASSSNAPAAAATAVTASTHRLALVRASIWHCCMAPSRLCMRWTWLSPTSPMYELVLLARELLEVTLQTYQAHKTSQLILSPRVNELFVGALLLNCWLSPCIHVLTRGAPAAWRRWLYLWADVALDATCTLVIPILVLASKFETVFLSTRSRRFFFDMPYDDVFLMDLLLSTKQLIIMDWVDLVSKLLPIYSIITYLETIQRLCRLQHKQKQQPLRSAMIALLFQRHRARPLPLQRLTMAFRRQLVPGKISSGGGSADLIARNRRAVALARAAFVRSLRLRRLSRLIHLVLMLWGGLVLYAHVRAEATQSGIPMDIRRGCKAVVRPWFVRRCACAVFELNCHRRGLVGTAAELEAVLGELEPSALASLIITHCPALEMPPGLTRLAGLVGLELTNVSLVDWPARAALTTARHPSLTFLSLVRTNLTALPDGLLAEDFPRTLRSIQIAVSGLRTLPLDLDRRWRRLLNLYIEHTPLTQIPETIARMRVERLSLLDDGIASIDDRLLEANAFTVLSLAGNPLRRLPKTIGSVQRLEALALDNSGLEELPAWLAQTPASIRVALGGSRLCRSWGSTADVITVTVAPNTPERVVSCAIKAPEEIEAYALMQNLRDRVP